MCSPALSALVPYVLLDPCALRTLVPCMVCTLLTSCRASRALVPYMARVLHALVPHVLCAIRALVSHVPRALNASVLYLPRALCGLIPREPFFFTYPVVSYLVYSMS